MVKKINLSPRMRSQIHGFSVIGRLNCMAWDGVVADLWNVRCVEGAGGTYVSPDPRLFVTIEMEGGGVFEFEDGETVAEHRQPYSMSYIPAGMVLRGRVSGLTRLKHLDLHFSETALTRRFGEALERDRLGEPRFCCGDQEMAALARMIACECASSAPMHDSYGAGLVDALLVKLFAVSAARRTRTGLSRPQLRRVTQAIEERCLETIRLAELAAMVGLSETHFSHAFKAATGLPPHRWQMRLRIQRVQELLTANAMSLSEISTVTGFSDQAHLTRVFKDIVGLTPARWRKGAPAATD